MTREEAAGATPADRTPFWSRSSMVKSSRLLSGSVRALNPAAPPRFTHVEGAIEPGCPQNSVSAR